MNKPKVLLYDLETSLEAVTVFSLKYNDFIDPASIIKERSIICASWRWLGESKIHSVSVLDNPTLFAKDPSNDKHVVEVLHGVMSEADVLVGHNSDNFDKKYVDTRILFHGLPALPPITSIDTYKIAKSKLLFNSNKLDYIGRFLGVGQKKHTTSGLWMRAFNGERAAIKEMISYNKQDVELLERVFNKLTPYIPNSINRELFNLTGCPRCGSPKIQSRGVHRAISRVYRRWQCQSCFGWFKSTKAEPGTTKYRIL